MPNKQVLQYFCSVVVLLLSFEVHLNLLLFSYSKSYKETVMLPPNWKKVVDEKT